MFSLLLFIIDIILSFDFILDKIIFGTYFFPKKEKYLK